MDSGKALEEAVQRGHGVSLSEDIQNPLGQVLVSPAPADSALAGS